MTPDEFKKMIQIIGNLIIRQAETTEIKIMTHVSKEIKASEERLTEHFHADIEASKNRTIEEILVSRTQAKKDSLHLGRKFDKITTSVRNLEENTGTPDPHKN